MQSFSITNAQIVSIMSALIAEELSRNVRRHVDAFTAASWTADSALGAHGIGLTDEELTLCTKRITDFFGVPQAKYVFTGEHKLNDIAQEIGTALRARFMTLTFTPAGDERSCSHRADHIFADSAAAANLFYGRRRFLSLVAPHSLLGFALTILTPNLQRLDCLDVRAMTPEALQNTLAFGDVLIATPTSWRYVLQQQVTAPDNVMGAFFGEPMGADLAADMRHAGFGAQREIYGSTETGLIGWRDSPTDPFVLFDHWEKQDGALRRVNQDVDADAVTPMDRLEWNGDRRFHLDGRRDGAIQVGALNVFPDKIAEVLSEHKLVQKSLVKVGRHGGGVNRLIAHIKLEPHAPPTEVSVRAIDQWCRTYLRPQERPCIFHFEESLEGL